MLTKSALAVIKPEMTKLKREQLKQKVPSQAVSRTKRGRLVLPPDEYKKLCKQVMQRDNNRCRFCKSRNNLAFHHIIFRSEGGDDISENGCTLCQDCHRAVHGTNGKFFLIILPASGNQEDPIDANQGLKFLKFDKVRRRIKLTPQPR
jgi:hypothetical protein